MLAQPARTTAAWRATRRVTQLVHHHFQTTAPAPCTAEPLHIPLPGRTLNARVYRPADVNDPLPGVIYFHGGGYTLCDLDTHDELCRWLASLGRATLVSVEYRFAPEHRFPAQLDDAAEATAWLTERREELRFAAGPLSIGGDSAGGFLAAHTAAQLNAAGSGAIALQLLLYPLMHVDEAACVAERSRLFRLIGRAAARTIGGHVLEDGAPAVSLSPHQVAAAPPTLIVSGGLDPIRSEAQGYAADLAQAGRPVEHLHFPWLHHGGLSFPGLLRTNLEALVEVGEALGRHLHPA